MPKLPAFIHIDLKSTSELAGKLTRHIEYTSRGNSQNMQIFGQNEAASKKLVLNPVLPGTAEVVDKQLTELSMHWQNLSDAIRTSILVMIRAAAGLSDTAADRGPPKKHPNKS